MPLRQKKLLKFVITHKNQDLEKAVLYWWRLVYCIAEAQFT